MAYIILLGIIKLQDFSKLVVKFVGRGLNIYEVNAAISSGASCFFKVSIMILPEISPVFACNF